MPKDATSSVAYSLIDSHPLSSLSNPMNLTTLTSADLAKITALLKTKEALLAKVAEIDKSLTAFESGKVATKSKMSPAARKKIAAAQKKRWAKINKGKKAAKPVAKGKKNKMSAAGRAAISAAAKAMWAKRNAEKAKKK